jgi:4-hydroxy-tetrahydrodipicolinate reductase
MSIKIAVLGRGRMGQEIQSCIAESEDLQLASIWMRDGSGDVSETPYIRSTNLASVLAAADVAIDFTLPSATDQVIAAALSASIPLVCGVSGLTADTGQHMADASKEIPILYDRNMSLGVAVMQQLVRLAGSKLGKQFAAEIHETHHVHKIDAPSGTALHLGETLAASRGQDFADAYHYDEAGESSPGPGDIHYEVTRRGEVPGKHTVVLRSADESLSLTHEVTDRRVFASGAIRAARWLVSQAPGLYSLQDLLCDTENPVVRKDRSP